MYQQFFKRIIDFLFSLAILFPLFLPLLAIALVIKLESKGPIFFEQYRVGKDLKNFKILKFRTMTHIKRKVGNEPIIGKAVGITKIGFYLRRFKVDEIPQLINVLLFQMSLIGPRPSVPEQLLNMTENEKKRYNIKPGLTGLSQISGNIHLSWKERYKLDLVYIDNITFLNDIKILFRTIFIVIEGEEKFLNKPFQIRKR
jgi:lipopolysaccharide/colanic/teichoic acid biosynthesis glycosyltransferase